jgi:hypothetical protein
MPERYEGGDLGGKLCEMAGTKVQELIATLAQVEAWNAEVDSGSQGVFEHRVLLGIGILGMRPAHGGVMDYHERVAERLDRSERWVRETVRVAGAVKEAIVEGITIPLDISSMGWPGVPWALENLRHGRPMRWKKPKDDAEDEQEPSVADRVDLALVALVDVLGEVEDDVEREGLIRGAVRRLEGLFGEDAGEMVEEDEERVPQRPGRGGGGRGAFDDEGEEAEEEDEPRRPGRGERGGEDDADGVQQPGSPDGGRDSDDEAGRPRRPGRGGRSGPGGRPGGRRRR